MRPTTLLMFCAPVLIGGCQTAPPTIAELQAMDDQALCAAVAADPLRAEPSLIMANRNLRCHPAQQACEQIGATGAAWRPCIEAMIDQMQAEEAMRRRDEALALGVGMQMLQTQQLQQLQQRQTVCSPVGQSWVCR